MATGKKILHQYNLLWFTGQGSSGLVGSTGYVTSPNMSSTALLVSKPIDMANWDDVAIFAKWAPGTPTGSFFLEASPNYNEDIYNTPLTSTTADWVTVAPITSTQNVYNIFTTSTSTALFQAAGSTGWGMVEMRQTPQEFMRMRYVPSSASSSGVLNVWVNAKQL